ncbi:SH3 domain-containing protein [Hoeflea sp. WL0058]|uniref:SH3 domain-containing protein n=1 Tax=Flavimaribacter sediminis TaxID=2865987 RepID=A0AAE2ZQB0_9HYPH|nr:SH3 domain-containing protein [Flavimaribacter sediminis]MBW8637682.1 SH3 domain-containing protein [Flavimaribacter sediminis]
MTTRFPFCVPHDRPGLLIAMLTFLFAAVVPIPASALEKGDQAVVATERLNLRSGPGTSHGVVLEMPEGTRLEITRIEDGWAQVLLEEDSSISGWTSAKYLSAVDSGPPADADAFFAAMAARHGEPRGRGSIAQLSLHYAYYCSNGGVGLALYREASPEPIVWEKEEWCVSDLEPRDIDGDGILEVTYFVSGGGTGTFGVKEKHLSWPPDADRPALGYEYRTLQADTYFNRDFEVSMEQVVVREMQYGQNCRADTFCPEWPEDAQCRPAMVCDIAQEGTMAVLGDGFPDRLRSDPKWLAYVQKMAAQGIVLEGAEVPPELTQLSLESLEAVDTGERPELTDERRAKIEEWLN